MKLSIFAFAFMGTLAMGQTSLPWGQALSVPLLAAQSGNAMFYVSSYSWSGTHTDYDMARQAADAYIAAHPGTPTYLVLNPAVNQTCDAVALPSISLGNGQSSTVSIIGYGLNVSSIMKRAGCAIRAATFSHNDSPGRPVVNAWFQGFSVNANHLDLAACEMYGMSASTFFDISCGNAAPGADHEMEVGNHDANSAGLMHNINFFNMKTFDSVGVGKGAVLTPVWNNGSLTGVTVSNPGTKKYTQQYVRGQIVGPDLSTCASVPTLTPTVSNLSSANFANLPVVNYGLVTGAQITNPGNCSSTARLYILIQDGVPATYGMKFSYLTSSHAWNLEATGSTIYGEAWMAGSAYNTIMGEHPYTNQTVQIAEYGSADKHYGAFFDSPGLYGAAIYGPSGAFTNSVFSWDSTSYNAASGYYLGAATYSGWTVQNSQCTNSTSNFVSITTAQGPIAGSGSTPAGLTLRDIEDCDGSVALDWETQVVAQ